VVKCTPVLTLASVSALLVGIDDDSGGGIGLVDTGIG